MTPTELDGSESLVRWLWFVLLGLLLIPVVEIGVLIAVGQQIGIVWALLATLSATVAGGFVVRAEGRRSIQRFRQTMESGHVPGAQASNGAIRMVGGVGLLVPGLVTDVIGLLLLLPPVRVLVRAALLRGFVRRVSPEAANEMFGPRRVRARRGRTRPASPQPAADPGEHRGPSEVVEGEIVEADEPDQRGPGRTSG